LLPAELKSLADNGAITFSVEDSGYVRTNEQTGKKEVWRFGMTLDPNNVEGGWYSQTAEYRSAITNTDIILELNSEGGYQTDTNSVYHNAQFTPEFSSRIDQWLQEYAPNLQNKKVIVALTAPGVTPDNSRSVLGTLAWESKTVIGIQKTSVNENTVFVRLYLRGTNDWFPGDAANEQLASMGLYDALILANYPTPLTNGAALENTISTLDKFRALMPLYFPNVPFGQGTLLVNLS